ncbi:hypothetical protein N7U66_17485 [Lacinutrix neustonica]|uniref:Nicotinic acid mononucleotide adenyltransferase n=1 Tax=Lacinutrix neustonica TaxID=2980107 RepID=A0A9E8MUL6_9FLAO|nr:hypothetical protein [Lacinutrix neustonica]WAC01691.1 hypothetical protein N7U66_17485 [Lacinutrix neustonica]
MKNLLYTFAILVGTTAYAQDSDAPVDHMESTKIKTERVKENGKTVETKVKVVTKKEQEVKTDPRQANQRDANQIIAPTKVTQTVLVDSDQDNNYEAESIISYYEYDDMKYAFKTNKNGFVVSTMDGDNEIIFGKAGQSSKEDLYIFNTTTYYGVGYFEGNYFVVDYYNKDNNVLMTQKFEQSKF